MAAFQFFDNYWDAFRDLDNETLGEVVRGMCTLAFDEEEPELSGTSSILFRLVRPFVEKSAERSKSGSRGGKSKTASQANSKQLGKLNPDSLATKRNETNRNEDRKKQERKSAFHAPTVSEVAEYMEAQNVSSFTASAFVDYYTGNGWKVGRNPMKDWRAAVRSWDSRKRREGAGNGYRRADEPATYKAPKFEG